MLTDADHKIVSSIFVMCSHADAINLLGLSKQTVIPCLKEEKTRRSWIVDTDRKS